MKKFISQSLVVLFCAAALCAGARPAESASASMETQRSVAPGFRLTDLNGKAVDLSSFSGKVVLIDFWATWCPPCRKMIPHLNDLYGAYRSKGFEVIGISLREELGTVKPFAQANKMVYTVAISSDGRVEQAYGGISGIPTTFLIDKKGRIAKKMVGYHEKGILEKDIRALLAE